MNRAILIFLCALATVAICPRTSHADIYMRRGPDGTLHFSNCPMGTEWKLYAKESKRQYQYASYTTQKKYSRTQYDNLITSVARNQGMNPSVIKSIIEVESGYNPYARSSKGAMGLMQLMPQTAQDLGVTDPWDPMENITGGTKYISWLIRKYNGNLMLALAAYNAGPSAVDSYGGIPPYQETADYVRNVLARIYGGGYAGE
ncbi:MAG TPA: lytic transglycosylase domain-containing protein [Deltaproteobacteria bacterium]|nr:lytic transglycosylase domain-containing protein [Deltaproteobacteria bacterium]HPR56494.1 lytic transglycosylase domain-containing protein [Deltaproteobacteria bacterium]HXK48450.1 lytic transglycosylase domain-containing protein [Deltaproteobacteria bacterium]